MLPHRVKRGARGFRVRFARVSGVACVTLSENPAALRVGVVKEGASS